MESMKFLSWSHAVIYPFIFVCEFSVSNWVCNWQRTSMYIKYKVSLHETKATQTMKSVFSAGSKPFFFSIIVNNNKIFFVSINLQFYYLKKKLLALNVNWLKQKYKFFICQLKQHHSNYFTYKHKTLYYSSVIQSSISVSVFKKAWILRILYNFKIKSR